MLGGSKKLRSAFGDFAAGQNDCIVGAFQQIIRSCAKCLIQSFGRIPSQCGERILCLPKL
jgi:hypothetical protein